MPLFRVALLSDAATQQFIPLLKTILNRNGFSAKIYEGAFDAIEIEAYSPSSGLYSFDPDAIVILNATQALRAAFATRNCSAADFVSESIARITGIWSAI